jgi:RHS repeat-associated protein
MTGASFSYDALGRRTNKTISGVSTGFLYDGMNPVQELSGTTPTANLLTGLGIDQFFTRVDSSGTKTLLTDALGSTLALTDSTGAVQTEYTYEPFGKTTITGTIGSNSFQFTGRENDGTELYYYRGRYYDNSVQRFISEDPIRLSGGTNLYSYVKNNPGRFADPIGLCKIDVHFKTVVSSLAYHTYITVSDNDLSGRKRYYRGGPETQSFQDFQNNFDSEKGAWGPIITENGDYVPGTRDWDLNGTNPFMNVLNDNSPCGPYDTSFTETLAKINQANISYSPLSTNSNAVVSQALSNAGFDLNQVQMHFPYITPGWGFPLLP